MGGRDRRGYISRRFGLADLVALGCAGIITGPSEGAGASGTSEIQRSIIAKTLGLQGALCASYAPGCRAHAACG